MKFQAHVCYCIAPVRSFCLVHRKVDACDHDDDDDDDDTAADSESFCEKA